MRRQPLLAITPVLAAGLAWFAWSSGKADVAAPLGITAAAGGEIQLVPAPELDDAGAARMPERSRPAPPEVERTPLATVPAGRCTTGRLVGRVMSSTNRAPLTAGRLSATPTSPPSLAAARAVAADVKHDGEYEMVGLEEGVWSVSCTVVGFQPQELKVFVPDGDEKRVLDFVLVPDTPPQAFIVHLHTPNGRAFRAPGLEAKHAEVDVLLRVLCLEDCPRVGEDLPAGVRILASHAAMLAPDDVERRNVPPANDDAWFRVGLSHCTSGCCCLLQRDRVLDVVPFGAGTTRMDMVVAMDKLPPPPPPRGSLTMVVVDDLTGDPLPKASVSVRYGPDVHQIIEATSGSAGWLKLDQLPLGTATVGVTEKEHQGKELTADIKADVTTDLGTVRLRRS